MSVYLEQMKIQVQRYNFATTTTTAMCLMPHSLEQMKIQVLRYNLDTTLTVATNISIQAED